MEIKLQGITLLFGAVLIFTVLAGAYMISNAGGNAPVRAGNQNSALIGAGAGAQIAPSTGSNAQLGGCSASGKTGGCGCGGGSAPANAGGVSNSGAQATASVGAAGAQDIYIKALAGGTYDPMQITVKKGVPLKLHFTADPNAGCGRLMKIYGISANVQLTSLNGEEQVAEFTPDVAGTFDYSCGMRMWGPGKFIVTA